MDDLISRTAAVDEIELGITYAKVINIETGEATELFKASNTELRKAIDRIKALPAAQSEYEELTPEEAASEIGSGSLMSAAYWLNRLVQIEQMGYVICRKR